MPERTLLLRAILLAPLLGGALSFSAFPAEDCLSCHGDPSMTTERQGKTVSLAVDPSVLATSAHGGLACLDCHAGFDAANLPHQAKITPVDCLSCHSDAPEKHSFHASMSRARGRDDGRAPSCKQCHGTHDVVSPKAPASPFHPTRLAESCGECHAAVSRSFVQSRHGQAVAAGVPGAPNCLTCHEKPLTPARWSGDLAGRKVIQEKMCLSCHLDDPGVRARVAPGAGFIAAYEKSVHGAALLRGNSAAANCVDCHGSHEMLPGLDPRARVSRVRIPETCARCHGAVAEKYFESIHAAAVRKGSSNAPVCTDCHGEHDILGHTDPRSPVSAGNVSAKVCSPCHSSLKLSEKYGIASDRFQTFADSFHGLAIRGGSVEVANCASCHGAHDIKASADPTSTVNPANLAATCGRCHPGATRRFAIGPVHVLTAAPQERGTVLYWVATLYVGLIVAVIGGMLVHNLLDFIRRAGRRLKRRRGGEVGEAVGTALYLRMTLGERLQHGALTLSFTVLVITGFMLRYPEAGWVSAIRSLSDHAFALRGLAHRIAAVVLVVSSLVHVGYATLTERGRRFVRDIFPVRRDVADLFGVVIYNLGLAKRRPALGRFSYVEKSEYWALVWGTAVMALTGVILWFENTFISLLTKLGWDIARTVHFYEAWLATLAILVWHFYAVIFNPDVYPMNSSWITGTLSEEEMAEEHPRELEALRRREAEEQAKARGGATNASAPSKESATD